MIGENKTQAIAALVWLALALVGLILVLPTRRPRATALPMSLAKATTPKPAAKKTTRQRSPSKVKFIKHPISGLPVVAARPGQKPLTSEEVRAMLADFP